MTALQKKYIEEFLTKHPNAKTSRKKKAELSEIEKFYKLHEEYKNRLKTQDRSRNRGGY